MKKEILVLVLLICIMLIGCAKAEDPRDTGSTMGEPDASVSEQNSDVLPTDGSSNAPEPTDVTEPADAADEDADLYKLPTVIGTYTDIYAEIGELEVMHYYPFAEWGSDYRRVNHNTTHSFFLCEKNGEEKNCAVFIGENDSACLICRNSKVEKVYFSGYIWDFSKTDFLLSDDYPLPDTLTEGIAEFADYDDKSEQIAVIDNGMVFKSAVPFAIKENRAYRLGADKIFKVAPAKYPENIFLITNGIEVILESINGKAINYFIKASINEDAATEVGYRAVGIDFSRKGSPFYVAEELTVDEYIDKKYIHGSSAIMIRYLEWYWLLDDDDRSNEIKVKIRKNNVTAISEVAKIFNEKGDLK